MKLYLVEIVCIVVKCVVGIIVCLVVFSDDGTVGRS